MFGIPWWLWLVGLLVLVVLFLWFARKVFRRQVREEVVEFLRERYPEIEITGQCEGFISIRSETIGEGKCFLDNVYAAVSVLENDAPEPRREVYQRFFGSLEPESQLRLETHGDRLLPRIVPPSFFEELPGDARVPHTPLEAIGLHVAYVLDQEQSVMYLSQEHLDELGLDVTSLHERALENLAKSFSGDVVRKATEGKALSVVKTMDAFDAARLLLIPRCLREGEEVAAIIPDRDILVVAPVPADDDWSELEELARKSQGQKPLLDRPLKVDRNGFRFP